MAAIQEDDMPEQREEAPSLHSENKTVSSQPLKLQIVSKGDNLPTIRLLKRTESLPKELTKTSNEVKIQKLKELTASQSKEMSNLKRKLAEAKKALAKEKEATNQLCVEVKKQKQIITNRQIEAKHFKSEMKMKEKEKQAAIAELTKSEEDKIELNAMLDSVKKEGLKINQTLTEEKSKGERQTRKLAEFKNKVDVLQTETAELHDAVGIFQNEIAGLVFINIIDEYHLTEQEYKLSLKNIAKKLEKTKTNTKTTCKHLKDYKVRSDRQGKIIEADEETKAEMKDNIVALVKENARLQKKLNSGFIGRYRQMKRFFVRVFYGIFLR